MTTVPGAILVAGGLAPALPRPRSIVTCSGTVAVHP